MILEQADVDDMMFMVAQQELWTLGGGGGEGESGRSGRGARGREIHKHPPHHTTSLNKSLQ